MTTLPPNDNEASITQSFDNIPARKNREPQSLHLDQSDERFELRGNVCDILILQVRNNFV